MRYLILDIETLPHPQAGQWLEPVEADAELLEPTRPNMRLKDPVKVAADRERVAQAEAERPQLIADNIAAKTAKRNEKLGLDPDCCVTACIGYHIVGGPDPFCDVTQGIEQHEKDALEHLAWEIRKADTKIVTFFGRQFDLPVIMRRAMYLGVDFPKLNLDRYRSPHIDVWDALTFGGALRSAHSLKFYCKRLGLQTGDPFDGAEVAQLAKEGRWDDIKTHCIADIGATHALANKLGLLRVA